MKKVIMSLVIGGLSVSGSCFAMINSAVDNKNFGQNNNLCQVKVDSTWSKVRSNAKKVLRSKKVRVALGVAGTAVAFGLGYKYSSSFQGFVDKGSEFVGSKLSDLISNVKGRSGTIPVTNDVCNPYPFVEKSPVSAWSNVWGRGFVEDVTDGVCNPYPSIKKPAVSALWENVLDPNQCSLVLKNVPDYCLANGKKLIDGSETVTKQSKNVLLEGFRKLNVLLDDFQNSEKYYEKLGNFATSAVDTVKAAVNSFVFLGIIYGLSR